MDPRPLRTSLTLVKAAALGCLLALVVVGGLRTPSLGGATPDRVDEAYARVVERTPVDDRCTSEPGPDGRGAALIRTERGEVRSVSFERAWAVYHGRLPGRLVAICADDRQPSARRHGLDGTR